MKKILIIDDEEILTRTFTKFLEKKGYDVFVACRGEDAEIMADEEDFDLIISDIRMPGKDGVETVKSIYKNKRITSAELPVIFISGFAENRTIQDLKKIKPLALLTKPFDINELMRYVAKVTEV